MIESRVHAVYRSIVQTGQRQRQRLDQYEASLQEHPLLLRDL